MTYVPSQMPAITEVEELRRFVQDEFVRVAQGLTVVDRVTFNLVYAAPPDPVAGLVVYADGTTWNPGAGRGLYEYRLGVWAKL